MLILAYDTSTFQSSVGWILTKSGFDSEIEAYSELIAPANPGHAETLLGRITSVLETGGHSLETVDLVVFGRGPGTFTGLRIGLCTAKALSIGLGIPIKGVSTLYAMTCSTGIEGLSVPLIDARRGEVYGAVLNTKMIRGVPVPSTLIEEKVFDINNIQLFIGETGEEGNFSFFGSGAIRYRELLEPFGTVLPLKAATLSPYWLATRGLEMFLDHGPDRVEETEPLYLREPDAKLPG